MLNSGVYFPQNVSRCISQKLPRSINLFATFVTLLDSTYVLLSIYNIDNCETALVARLSQRSINASARMIHKADAASLSAAVYWI